VRPFLLIGDVESALRAPFGHALDDTDQRTAETFTSPAENDPSYSPPETLDDSAPFLAGVYSGDDLDERGEYLGVVRNSESSVMTRDRRSLEPLAPDAVHRSFRRNERYPAATGSTAHPASPSIATAGVMNSAVDTAATGGTAPIFASSPRRYL
jgi:hypothetical protein